MRDCGHYGTYPAHMYGHIALYLMPFRCVLFNGYDYEVRPDYYREGNSPHTMILFRLTGMQKGASLSPVEVEIGATIMAFINTKLKRRRKQVLMKVAEATYTGEPTPDSEEVMARTKNPNAAARKAAASRKTNASSRALACLETVGDRRHTPQTRRRRRSCLSGSTPAVKTWRRCCCASTAREHKMRPSPADAL